MRLFFLFLFALISFASGSVACEDKNETIDESSQKSCAFSGVPNFFLNISSSDDNKTVNKTDKSGL